jgi:ribonucleoside-diphosphate reductase alpha chain
VNPHLVRKLKALDLWDDVMINDLKYFEGSLGEISRIPDDIKKLFSTAFEVEPRYIVESASRRQKWIDQAQSLNLYIGNANGKKTRSHIQDGLVFRSKNNLLSKIYSSNHN